MKNKKKRESRKKSILLKNRALTDEQKHEKTLIILQDKIEVLENVILQQGQTISQ